MKTWHTSGGYTIIRVISGRSNVFLLINKDKKILIDTGPGFMWRKLDQKLQKLNIFRIDYLILTHTHFDHAGNSFRIKEKYKARVIAHKNEASYLISGENIIPEGTNLFTRIIVKLFAKRFLSAAKYDPCQYDLLVDSYTDLNDYGFNAYLMHTPGHTTGSMSLIIGNEVAIVGDTMFGIFKWSVYPPYANDTVQMLMSWDKLLKTGCSVFLPSHGSANSRAFVQKCYDKKIRKKVSQDIKNLF